MKNKLLGHMVKVRRNKKYPDPYAGQRGEVMCVVRSGRFKIFIVQFENDWFYFHYKQLKIDE